jgi:ankyrin repeat protein
MGAGIHMQGTSMDISTLPGWQFEGSLSQKLRFIPITEANDTAKPLLLFWFLSLCATSSPLLLAKESAIFDCIRFAENGNDIIVDHDCIVDELRRGADPNSTKREGTRSNSVLHRYVMTLGFSRDPKVLLAGTEAVKTLIDAGAKLQTSDSIILYWPIAQGNVPLTSMLLDLGASASAWPNDEIGTALTPVETAAAEGNDQMVALLEKHGATRPQKKMALQEQFVRSARSGSVEQLQSLLAQGATVSGSSRDNETALTNAILLTASSDCSAWAKVHWLLDHGADPNQTAKGMLGNGPPLHYAVRVSGMLYEAKRATACSDQMLRDLIDHGAKVAGRDAVGRTPLHIAAETNNMVAARMLIDSGSTIMPKDNSGKTPLDLAESSAMIKLLKQHGAVEH